MALLQRLGVVLGINIDEFVKGFDEATKKTTEFEIKQIQSARQAKKAQAEWMAALGKGATMIAAFGLALAKTFQQADEISDLAKGFDTTIERLLATQSALQGAGGHAEDLSTMFQKLSNAQDSAREGNDALRESFTRLGISGGQVDALKIDDLFLRVARALAEIDDKGTRAAVAQDLLGKAVKGVDWGDLVEKYHSFSDPELVDAIEKSAEQWERIEKALKSIKLLAIKIGALFADMVNDSFKIAKNFKEAEAHKYGIASVFMLMFAPKTIAALPKGKSSDIFDALPPERVDTPMLMGGDEGYKKQSEKELAAGKKSASDARRNQESRDQLRIEIDLLQKKSAISEKVFALNSAAITAGQQAIEQQRMIVDLENDIYEIRAKAKEARSKEGAQRSLINQKEKQEIDNRVKQFGFDNSVRIQSREREHTLAMKAIVSEAESKRDALTIEATNEKALLDLDKDRFALGSSAYALKKQEQDAQNKIRTVNATYAEQLKTINAEYEKGAKTAETLEEFETKISNLKKNQEFEISLINQVEDKKKANLEAQLAIEQRLFDLDLAQQKDRDIGNIQFALSIDRQRMKLEGEKYLMTQAQYEKELLRLDNAYRLVEAEKKYADQQKAAFIEMERLGGGQKAKEQYDQKIASINETKEAELQSINEINAAREKNQADETARQLSFTEGWKNASRKYAEDATMAFNRGSATFASVMTGMNSGIAQFVETGKFKFEEFSLSIIKDLIKIQLQAQATQLLSMLFSAFGAPAAPSAVGNAANGVAFQLPRRASGGSIDGPSIVGENGPEIFIPSRRGTIIPNTIASSMMGSGGAQTVYNGPYIANMSAIDTQSAAQFLAKNKSAVWGAYQSANRTVPISR